MTSSYFTYLTDLTESMQTAEVRIMLTLQAGLMYWVRGNCVITHRRFDVLGMQCVWSLSKEHIYVNFCPIFKPFRKAVKTSNFMAGCVWFVQL
jgi:hypothetical protein